MKRFLTTVAFLTLILSVCKAQAIVEMKLSQNPLFEVFTNDVNVGWPEGASSIMLGGDIVVKGGSGVYTYRWYNSNSEELGTETILEVFEPDVYFLDIADTCDCLQTIRFDIGGAGVESSWEGNIVLTPNPTEGYIKIAGIDALQLTATSLSGKLSALIDYDGRMFDEVNLHNLPSGVYIIAVTDVNGKVYSTKLIKK